MSDRAEFYEDIDEGLDAYLRGEEPPKREAPNPEPLHLIDVADLEGIDPPSREWIVDGFLPAKSVVLFSGKGGAGKSTLAIQLGEMLRRGHAFLGMKTHPCTTLLFSCEDDGDELHRRHARMQRGLGTHTRTPGRLLFAPRVGDSNALIAFDARTGITVKTPAFDSLRETVLALAAKLVVIDTVAQTFAGNENDRAQVTGYVNVLAGLALEMNGCVLLLAHPPKNEAEYSGSTGWDGTVRARALLYETNDDGLTRRFLKLAKANYSPKFEHEIVVDDYGVSHLAESAPETMADKIGAYAELVTYKAVFLRALDKLTEQQRAVSHSNRAANYAPKIMIQANLHEGSSLKNLQAAMESLFGGGLIQANAEVGRRANYSVIIGIARTVRAENGDEPEMTAEIDLNDYAKAAE